LSKNSRKKQVSDRFYRVLVQKNSPNYRGIIDSKGKNSGNGLDHLPHILKYKNATDGLRALVEEYSYEKLNYQGNGDRILKKII
jgi:hypothetical protein